MKIFQSDNARFSRKNSRADCRICSTLRKNAIPLAPCLISLVFTLAGDYKSTHGLGLGVVFMDHSGPSGMNHQAPGFLHRRLVYNRKEEIVMASQKPRPANVPEENVYSKMHWMVVVTYLSAAAAVAILIVNAG